MNRRFFIASAVALLVAPQLLLAGGANTLDYKPGLIAQKLAEGKTVFVDYAAQWCGTCKRQERIVSKLRAENPSIDEHIVFVRVDWDQYSDAEVTTSRKIPRRSTLLLLKGDEELGRIVAGTRENDIKVLLEKGLPA